MIRLDPRRPLAFVLLLLGSLPLLAQSPTLAEPPSTPQAVAEKAPSLFAVTAPVADMHRTPSADSDVVSQAIFGSTTLLLEEAEGWVKVRTSDDYEGWIDARELHRVDAPYARDGKIAMVATLFASLYREADIEKHEPVITLPYEAKLEISGHADTPEGRFYSVRLPDGATAWIQSGDLTFENKPLSIAETIELAHRFIGIPYRWGGTSSYGFDCSGFTQMLLRRHGVSMPRDTRPQSRWDGLVTIERAQLQPGDLIFFGKVPTKVNHTGMYIGNGRFIHATRYGARPTVQIGELASEPWTTQFISARRVP